MYLIFYRKGVLKYTFYFKWAKHYFFRMKLCYNQLFIN